YGLPLGTVGPLAERLHHCAVLHRVGGMPRWSMLWPAELIHLVRRVAPDIVHTHTGVWYKLSLAARLARVPKIVHTEHGRMRPDPWQARLVDHLASRRTDAVIAVS